MNGDCETAAAHSRLVKIDNKIYKLKRGYTYEQKRDFRDTQAV